MLLFMLCMSLGLFAQNQTNVETAMNHISEQTVAWDLKSQDIENMFVSDNYVTKHNGVNHIYFNQSYKGIPIHNAISNIAITKDGKVAIAKNGFVANIDKKINTATPQIKVEDALQSIAQDVKAEWNKSTLQKRQLEKNKYVFDGVSFARNQVPAELKYQITEDGSLRLVWDLSVDMTNNSDYWSMRVDAITGEVISKNNWTVYCQFDDNPYHNHSASCKGHHHHSAKQEISESAKMGASYRVYGLPAESPIHGDHIVVTDPHYVEASPLGWHDTDGQDGAEFTTTQGNNVHAYLDVDADNGPDTGGYDGGDDLIFDVPHDYLSEDPDVAQDAAMINLFYMNNMMHDLMYLMSFDEVSGNFQTNTYGNGGNGGDHVLAEAQDGSGTNNANFSTPGDGGNGRMQMFLWDNNSGGLLNVNSPSEISGIISPVGISGEIGQTIAGAFELSGEAALVNDDFEIVTDGCQELVNADDIAGKIALVDRGNCSFSEKAFNAEQAGAVGILICNIVGVNGGTGEETINMAATPGFEVTIPALFLPKSQCDKIKVSLEENIPVELTMREFEAIGPQQWDASFDNGIIAHEYGHGISNRLTGGPSAAGCLGTAEQMGEGWSDFFSLITTVEPGDSGEDVRGIGNYANSDGTNGRGIRRFPYSTDMSVNPQTYDDIKGTTAPHPVGEVWVDMLWDMYWRFVDVYGYDADWTNTESGNYRAILLVMDGMRLQGCNPGFIAGRDAIVEADILNYDGMHECMLWEIFARRGLGIFADGGSANDVNDGTENFDAKPQCIEELKISKSINDLIEAGDDIQVTLTVTNHIPNTLNGVVVTDELPAGSTLVTNDPNVEGVISGDMITFDLGSMELNDEVTLSYTLKSNIDQKSTQLFFDDIEQTTSFWDIPEGDGNALWLPSAANPRSGVRSWYVEELGDGASIDQSLVFGPYSVPASGNPTFRFWHDYDTQTAVDGGFVQISTNGGVNWSDAREHFIRNGYAGSLDYSTFAIPSLDAFSGSSDGYIDSYIDLSTYAGQDIQLRFRFGCDEADISGGEFPGWFIDDVEVMDLLEYTTEACVSDDGQNSACTGTLKTIVNADPISSTTGVEEDYFNLEMFPNPTSNKVTLLFSAKVNSDANIVLSTIEGRELSRDVISIGKEVRSKTLDVSSFTTGLYLVRIETTEGAITKKLSVN